MHIIIDVFFSQGKHKGSMAALMELIKSHKRGRPYDDYAAQYSLSQILSDFVSGVFFFYLAVCRTGVSATIKQIATRKEKRIWLSLQDQKTDTR